MIKDVRYTKVGNLITDGRIITFRDIFDVLPKSIMACDLGMNNVRFKKLRNNVSLFRLKELFKIADLLEIEETTILTLIYNQYSKDKKIDGYVTPQK